MSKPQSKTQERVAEERAKQAIQELSAEIVEAPVAARMSLLEQNANQIRSIEDAIHIDSMDVAHGAIAAFEIDPMATEPPEEWIQQFGKRRAWVRFRAAQAGMMNAKEAPVAIKVATQVMTGITKARATEKQAPRTLNVALVQMSAPLPEFPEQILEKRK